MKCQECREREATLHLKQVVNGQKKEIHVCDVCAKEKGYKIYPDEGYSLHHLLSGLFNYDSQQMDGHQNAAFKESTELQCPQCQITFSEFKRVGKFGCSQCYETFSDKLDPIFRRVHSGNNTHHGKIPKRKGGDMHIKKKLESYRSELKRLVEKEEFEKAANVRDIIKKMEKELRQKEAGDNA
ncbi:MAG TPA: UvrB/UvrC motif-containing protein [Bacillota bacterium]|nr:UvrB/UvrC motif-containing protein [Bacillota bacterium]